MGICSLNLTIHSAHLPGEDVARLHSRADAQVIGQIDNESAHPLGDGCSSIGGAAVDAHDVSKGGILLDAGNGLAQAALFIKAGMMTKVAASAAMSLPCNLMRALRFGAAWILDFQLTS